jgi:N-acetylglucosamine-6-phosphate deacetylase
MSIQIHTERSTDMSNNGADDSLVIKGKHVLTGEPISLHIADGRIDEVKPIPHESAATLPWIGPGLVDLQINGYNGSDFNTLPLTEATVRKATQELWREGVTSYFPTIITNSDEEIEAAVRVIANACMHDQQLNSGIAGIHLEGPFISPEDGPRGAHSKAFVEAPDWSRFVRWQEAARGKIKLITLSPEWPGSADFISRCVDNGVTVSLGHTAASPEQIREAVAAGARLSTHLGNGAHLMLPRHPNYIWEQLAQEDLWTCVIADGFHLPDSVLKVIMKVKGKQAMLVSDAVSLSGMEPGEYNTLIGGNVVLTPEGKLHLKDNPKILAGSVQMLKWGIEHLVGSGLAELSEAWEMASTRPALFMKLPFDAGISVGAPADLVVFEWENGQVTIRDTYKNGINVFANHV